MSKITVQRHPLGRWLFEWAIEQHLRALAPVPAAPSSKTKQPADSSWRGQDPLSYTQATDSPRGSDPVQGETLRHAPQPGELWLLHPSRVSVRAFYERPVYALVLAAPEDGRLNVIPFSRFSVPAVTGEWRTGLRQSPLRVLCIWNRRRLSAQRPLRGWFCLRVKSRFLERTRDQFWRFETRGISAEDSLRDHGPPLLHPDDPRHAYLAEESTLLDELLGATSIGAASEPPAQLYPTPSSQMLLAAEARTAYRTRNQGSGIRPPAAKDPERPPPPRDSQSGRDGG